MSWVRNIASNYLRFVTSLIVMAVMTPVIIDAIGVDAYGEWAIVYAAIALVGLSDLGFATAAIKFLAEAHTRQPGHLQRTTGALLAVYSLLTTLCALIVAGVYLAGLTPLPTVFGLLGISATFIMGTSVHRAYLIAAGQQETVNWITIAGSIGQALMSWYALDAGYGVIGLAAAHTATQSAQAIAFVVCGRASGFPRPDFTAPRSEIARIARFSVWALLANGAFMLILRIDPLLIEQILDARSVALFAIALKVGEQVLLFNKQFSNALLPLISQRQGRGDLAARADLLVYATRYLLVIAVPLTGLLACNAEDLLVLWIGDDVRAAATPLAILALAALASTTQFNAANINGMSGQPRFVALTMLISAAVKIGLGLLLLAQIGIVGAAIATLIAAISIEAFCNIHRACRITGISLASFLRHAIWPGLICGLPALAFAVLDSPATSFWQLLATNGLYGATSIALFVMLFVGEQDRRFFDNHLAKEKQPCVASTAS